MPTSAYIFLIILLGYVLGSIRIKGISFGASGILLTALVFGHFGVEIPSIIREFGLACFVSSVSLLSASVFVKSIRRSALGYVVTGMLTVVSGALICALAIIMGIPKDLSIGVMTGALTSTPGLAAAAELAANGVPTAGYGIAYPFGVIGVVLFVQIMPRYLPREETVRSDKDRESAAAPTQDKKRGIDPQGMFVIAVTTFLGILLGQIKIPLPMNGTLSLGTSGGPLVAGLIVGNMRSIGPISLRCPRETLTVLREIGLACFFAGAGTQAGAGFVEIVTDYGVGLFLWGAAMTAIPMFVSLFLARKVFKMDSYTALSTVCGGMTSTPSLGALLQVAQDDRIAAGYTATYPSALLTVVLSTQVLYVLF